MDWLDLRALVFISVVVLLLLAFLALPAIIADHCKHPRAGAIGWLCALSLVLPILWPVALVWAFIPGDPPATPPEPDGPRGPARAIRYLVIGIDRETGEDAMRYFSAGSADLARSKAQQIGMVVTRVEPVG